MTSAVAVLTRNRLPALRACMDSLLTHCPQYPIAVFEDCGFSDGTSAYLAQTCPALVEAPALHARQGKSTEGYDVYLGTSNAGVAGNTNRALGWFFAKGYDHVVILNDDVVASGDFVAAYAEAHAKTHVGLFCFTDFSGDSYNTFPIMCNGVKLKMMTRMTGIAMSYTRDLVTEIGFYDVNNYGKFGNEHCGYTDRARFAGYLTVKGVGMHCLDVSGVPLAHQAVASSVPAEDKPALAAESVSSHRSAAEYAWDNGMFFPFQVTKRVVAGAKVERNGGLLYANLRGYEKIDDSSSVLETR